MKKTLKITGMHCESCVKVIELELQDQVNSISINLKTGIANIDFDESQVSMEQIESIIKKQGYEVKAK